MALEALIDRLRKKAEQHGWAYLGEGWSRYAYRMNDFMVVKIPKSEEGFADNRREAKDYEKGMAWHGPQMAWCRLLPNGCLLMEYVTPPAGKWSDLPEWCSYVDCYQVGYTRDKALVAYDWAY